MSDQILPMMERMPTEYEEQRLYAIRKIEEIRDRATLEMKPWVDFLARIEATRPSVYYIEDTQYFGPITAHQQANRRGDGH